CDAIETEQLIEKITEIDGPCYVRMCRMATEQVHSDDYQFEYGKADLIQEGKDVLIIASGLEVLEALEASKILEKDGIKPTILNIHTIKPLDEETIVEMAKKHKVVVTAEEHSIIGGLGSAVADCLVRNYPCKVGMIGVQDVFGESGTPQELFKKYGLDGEAIANKVKEMMNL
ncbi:MAG: transketolase family protein, partial [Traorella sp.]